MTLNEVLRQSDLKFLKRFIKKIYPTVKLNWHHLKIIQLLENAALNPNKKYTISMPPRHGKSLLCSEIFPAWYLANNPEEKVIACSYGASLASDFGRKVRNYMQSEAVTDLANKKLLSQDSKSVNRFNTIQGGTYIAVGSGGSLTGFGGKIIICDDLQKSIEDASNDALTEKLFEWFTSTLYTRLQPNGSIVVIGTRWHENDIIGRIKQNDKDNSWEHLVIPAISEDGEALWDEWIPKTKLLEIKKQIGTYNFNALYQQDPTPQTGNIIKKEWIQTIETPIAFTDVCISWDLAFKGNDNSDYCVGQLWGRAHNKFYLIDQVRRKIDFVETTTAFDEFYKKNSKYKPTTILVEDAANGAALYSHFKTKYPFIKLIKPIKSKELRVLKVSPIFENKNIFLTTNLSIEQRETITSEILKFPNAVNDDIVDAATQAIDFLSSRNQIGSSFSTGGESVLSF